MKGSPVYNAAGLITTLTINAGSGGDAIRFDSIDSTFTGAIARSTSGAGEDTLVGSERGRNLGDHR